MNLSEFMTKTEVLTTVGIAPPTLAYLVKNGRFPQPVTITRRNKVWERDQVNQWIAERVAERDALAEQRRG